MANVGNGNVGVHDQLGLKGSGERDPGDNVRTHIEDAKEPVEVRLPRGNRLPIGLRMDKSRDRTPPAPFDDFPLDLRNGSAIKSTVSELSGLYIAHSTHIVN